jgi:hypothetical protein
MRSITEWQIAYNPFTCYWTICRILLQKIPDWIIYLNGITKEVQR